MEQASRSSNSESNTTPQALPSSTAKQTECRPMSTGEVEVAPPPHKRSRIVADEADEEEAISSTSQATASPATTTLAAPTGQAAEATPTKKQPRISPPRTAAESTTSSLSCTTSVASSSTLRYFRKIPIFIVDYHNDVLEFLYRCLATRHLPLENNILVHFDSHPDMVINRNIPASASYDKDIMLEKLSIESWIMPSCFTGHFNRVVWLKNSWCQQIPVGKYNFKVGQKDDKICIDSTLDYFVAEGNYCPASEMQESRDLELQVFNADTDNVQPTDFLTSADANSFILDIDLDFFSTSNPFLEIYSLANCYERLTEIFHFEVSQSDCNGTSERRKDQLRELRVIFEHLEATHGLDNLPASVFEVIPESTLEKIRLLHETLNKHYSEQEIDWLLIYDSGCTTDSNGLPHHVSSDEELEQYFENLKMFLERLPVPPVAITMACSAEDDYCPKFQVQEIQDRVLELFQEVFGERVHSEPILQYMDDEWDVMEL